MKTSITADSNLHLEDSCLGEQKLNHLLEEICHQNNWDYGEIWRPDLDSNCLELSEYFYIRPGEQEKELELFRLCSQYWLLSLGEGLPGRVWQNKQPEWIVDVTVESEGYFLRNCLAKAFGIKTGFAIPLKDGDVVKLVLVFFSCDRRYFTS